VELLFAYLIVMYAVLFCRSEITNMAMATMRNFGFIRNNFNVQKTRFLSSTYFLNTTTTSNSITTIITIIIVTVTVLLLLVLVVVVVLLLLLTIIIIIRNRKSVLLRSAWFSLSI